MDLDVYTIFAVAGATALYAGIMHLAGSTASRNENATMAAHLAGLGLGVAMLQWLFA